MSKYGIIVNADDCVGCYACFVACKEENQVAPGVKWNHLERLEHPAEQVIEYFRVSCMHCEDPACMKACPVKAVYFGSHGEVLVDQTKCIGCKGCLAACPYGAPKFSDPNKQSYFGELKPLGGPSAALKSWQKRIAGRAEHCTLCTHRTSEGRLPACVEVCSTHALQLVDYDKPTDAQKALIARAQMINQGAGTSPKVRFVSLITDFTGCKVRA
ncbi:MAG: 4Fe-4S dicluster domain-containing protein [Burkholderiales bacterium]|nr:4Fe-4S dicluster domain-containing protein [Burkholderiales bacterium]